MLTAGASDSRFAGAKHWQENYTRLMQVRWQFEDSAQLCQVIS